MDFTPLISIINDPGEVGYPVVLPDFFLDHFILTESFEMFISGLRKLAEQGGGNLLQNEQFIRRGGNALNTASALHTLGLDPKVILTTDEQGSTLLQALVDSELDLSHVHVDGRLSSTVSIETQYQGRKVNLMVSDSGSVREFSFSDLTEDDLATIRGSSLVALVSLNHNLKGSELAHDLFKFVKESGDIVTFMDMGDPSSNPDLVRKLIKQVISEGVVDIVGLNENEVRWIAKSLSNDSKRWQDIHSKPLEWLKAAEFVSSETGIQVDLHTPYYTATIGNEQTTSIPVFTVESRVLCGAGDAWNAGDILGILLDLSPKNRLILANAVAALYVSSSSTSHPTLAEIVTFLEQPPLFSGNGTKLLKL
ncbi:MAG: carbohydrate kinase family protein [Candidatus Thorarchaeota archaeon]